MRSINMFGIAVVAALAIGVILGPTYAQATTDIVMCKTEEAVCTGGVWSDKLLKEGGASNVIFLGFLEEKCTKSELHGKVLTKAGVSLGADIEKLTFSECTPCTSVTVEALPYGSEIKVDAGDVYLWITPFVLQMSGCKLGMKCRFEISPISLTIENLFTGQHIVEAKEEVVGLTEGLESFCGKEIKWDATYTITSPLKFWFALLNLP